MINFLSRNQSKYHVAAMADAIQNSYSKHPNNISVSSLGRKFKIKNTPLQLYSNSNTEPQFRNTSTILNPTY